MSFSSSVKEELSREITKARHCQMAEIAGIISFAGKVKTEESDIILSVYTENVILAKRYFELVRKAFKAKPELIVKNRDSGRRIYKIEVIEKLDNPTMFEALKWQVENTEGEIRIEEPVNKLLLMKSCCKRAYLRGAFFSAGSVTDPGKGYHLEIVSPNDDKADRIISEFAYFGIEVKKVIRKGHVVCYIKEGEQISDALNVIGAHTALMELENVRIIKEVRNDVNRRVNCETANINKTVNAAVKQIEDIEYIDKHLGLDNLSPLLQETARIRLENPEAPLKELAGLLGGDCGKSGLNHRLKKLHAIAEELRGTSGGNNG
ncbi:MAG: DNA-binding protein WhiA [Lachnospiraceae bacterium]|nr:DNA-binding protein WhiA [Lachnospiraceae bacterium]